MLFQSLRTFGIKQLNIFLLFCCLGFPIPALADFTVGPCTVADPVLPPNSVTECSGLSLNSLDFSGLNLTYANFSNANLSIALFDNSDLKNADFTGADWTATSFVAVTWGNTTCPDGTNSNQYTGDGCLGAFADDDLDGVNNPNDAFPNNEAASEDSDADGHPDFWNKYCDLGCQSSSGLMLDDFPQNIAASIDADHDGFPEAWNTVPVNCNATCQSNSGLAIDAGLNAAGAIFVDVNTPTPYGSGADGLSWNTAWPALRDALAVVTAGKEIWIANGVYYPDVVALTNTNTPADTFALVNKTALVGGFIGGETLASQALPEVNLTVLSGDIDQNDTNVDGNGIHTGFETSNLHNGTNSHHVVTTSQTVRISGVIISGGGSGVAGNEGGGGINANGGKLTLQRVKMFYNRSLNEGGAIRCSAGTLILEEVEISHSYSLSGAGIDANNSCNVEIYRSSITNNTAGSNGGGIYLVNGSKAIIENSTFAYNTAVSSGGGIRVQGSGAITSPRNLKISFSTVAYNSSGTAGGIWVSSTADIELIGVVVVGNTAGTGANIYRTATDEVYASYSSFGENSAGGLYINGTGLVSLAAFLTNGSEPTVSIPNQTTPFLIENALTNQGGPTPVLRLLVGGSLINAIPEYDCKGSHINEDQRGFPRPYELNPANKNCDIGAYESNDYDSDGQPDNFDVDDDNDGMPDTFENTYGFNPFFADDATTDFDGDTLTNLDEYNLGTDPTVFNTSEVEKDLVISPRSYRYGYEAASSTCQTTSTPVTYIITNNDKTPRDITDVIFFSGDTDWQLKTAQDGCSNTTVAANGGTCTFKVVYCGEAVGNRAAIINVPNDDKQTPTLTSAVFNSESLLEEAQRRLPPVLSELLIEDAGGPITDGLVSAGVTTTYTWTITGYHQAYDSLIAVFDCTGIAEPDCGKNYNNKVAASAISGQDTSGTGLWSYDYIVSNTYTYSYAFSLPTAGEYVIRFYRVSPQDIYVGNPSLSLLIPGKILPLGTGHYGTDGRRIKIQVIP